MAGSNAPASLTTAPAPVDGGLTFKSIVAGWLHACGITTSGAAYCWGANGAGQLGIGTIDGDSTHRSPEPVVGGLQFIQLSLGSLYSCGITVDHQAYCWGENFTGQLGDATTTNRGSPTLVAGGQRFAFIAAGSGFASGSTATIPPSGQAAVAHVCALTESGAPWCWGWNGAGQLGDGTTTDHTTPAPVSGSLQLTSLGLGGSATCGRRGNAIWCWGGNVFGQLGNGTVASSAVPVLVQSPFSVP
jgi:alpha-tubulin suppressor-like RCC1 family protein